MDVQYGILGDGTIDGEENFYHTLKTLLYLTEMSHTYTNTCRACSVGVSLLCLYPEALMHLPEWLSFFGAISLARAPAPLTLQQSVAGPSSVEPDK